MTKAGCNWHIVDIIPQVTLSVYPRDKHKGRIMTEYTRHRIGLTLSFLAWWVSFEFSFGSAK